MERCRLAYLPRLYAVNFDFKKNARNVDRFCIISRADGNKTDVRLPVRAGHGIPIRMSFISSRVEPQVSNSSATSNGASDVAKVAICSWRLSS